MFSDKRIEPWLAHKTKKIVSIDSVTDKVPGKILITRLKGTPAAVSVPSPPASLSLSLSLSLKLFFFIILVSLSVFDVCRTIILYFSGFTFL